MHFVTIALLLHLLRLTCLLIHNEWSLHDFDTILVSGPNMASIVVKLISANFPKLECENSIPLPFTLPPNLCARHKNENVIKGAVKNQITSW